MQSKHKHLVVIGGGISGLAAAHRLVELTQRDRQDCTITLLEAGDRVGGVIKTIRRDGYLLEAGPDNFITNKPWALELSKRLGLEDELLHTQPDHRRALVVRKGRLVPIPEGFLLMAPQQIWPIICSPIFSWRGKLRMAMERFVGPAGGPDHSHAEDADESLASFTIRRFGREALDRIVQPLVGGIYTADPEILSMRATLPQFLDMEKQYGSVTRGIRQSSRRGDQNQTAARYSLFVSFKQGMGTLLDRLTERIGQQRIKLGTRATKLSPIAAIDQQPPRWNISTQEGDDLEADGVIVALRCPQAAAILNETDSDLAAKLSEIEYSSSAVVHFAYKRDQIAHPLDAFGFVIPHIEGRNIIAGSISSVKYAGRAPQGHVLLRAFLGGTMQAEILGRDDQGLTAAAQTDIHELLGITGEPLWTLPARWPDSMPQYSVGQLQRADQIQHAAGKHPGICLIGNGYGGVGIPDCVHAAEQAAEQTLRQLGIVA